MRAATPPPARRFAASATFSTFAAFAGSLALAFAAGAATPHALRPPPATAGAPAIHTTPTAWHTDDQSVGRDIYSPRGTPVGRLSALIGGSAGQAPYAIIATYGRDAAVAGEIAVPASRLDLQDGRLVLSGAPHEASADAAPARWQM